MSLVTAAQIQTPSPVHRPSTLLSRVGLRFMVLYFSLFCLLTQIINCVLAVPKVDVPDWGTVWPIRPVIFWVAAHLFKLQLPLVYSGSGSGDKQYDWVLVFCITLFAAIA